MEIRKVAVIGSGVMGSAIAAHVANSGTPVLLMDIVPEGAENRNALAEGAVERMKKADPAPFTHASKIKLVTPGNLEDDLGKLADVDWIIEAVLERLDVKHDVYRKIDSARKKGSVVSSNTSTIPLHHLIEGMPEAFKHDFMITHFFNPPRYMRLLELLGGPKTKKDSLAAIHAFADKNLGKGVVLCKDTPGFIANRIGCFWMTVGVLEAMKLGVSVEEADAVMGKPVGIPKTGVFGLLDLIGIDLMPLIAKAFKETLPPEDMFLKVYEEPALVKKMIADGYTGRKGKGGFYRLNKKEDGSKVKEVIDLKTGEYHPAGKADLKSVESAKSGLRSLLTHPDKGGQYAAAVMLQTLAYTASLIPEMAEDITSVDEAMRLGYNWKYGPFELIDRLGDKEISGAAWLAAALKEKGMEVPPLLTAAGNNSLYKKSEEGKQSIDLQGKYHAVHTPQHSWMLADKKTGKKPVKKNPSCAVWDIGDGVLCLEYTSKMNSVDPQILDMMQDLATFIPGKYKGLVIGNDADNFCVGANLGFVLFTANMAAWKMIDHTIKQGQDAYMALKYAPFPVVTAVSGMALGGGCEILMHSDAVQAHMETYTGLVEVGVGFVPGWGGCKEMLLRHSEARQKEASVTAKLGRMFSGFNLIRTANTMPSVIRSFEQIAMAKVAKSADEARDMLILRENDRITMNRARLLPDAKARVLELATNYAPPKPATIRLPGKTARAALYMGIRNFVKSGKATAHDEVVSKALADVLSGGSTDISNDLTEQNLLDLEREAFMYLVKTKGTLARVEHMLETGKPLRN